MARPRVFVSSTYYDLKHLRSSLENFIESLGFEAVLSEKGRIAYSPDLPLDDSCYREVSNADMLVLVVGGRYGSEAGSATPKAPKSFFDRYNSITAGEYRAAIERNIPVYILVERSVYAEFETFLRNKNQHDIAYAHVDSVNVFHLIDEISSRPLNNPIQQFDKYSEIETWLREQWAGLFRELLRRMQTQAQIASLQTEVAQLSEVNKTLKTYLEEVMSRVAPATSQDVIAKETRRLASVELSKAISDEPFGMFLRDSVHLSDPDIQTLVLEAKSLDEVVERILPLIPDEDIKSYPQRWLADESVKKSVGKDLAALRRRIRALTITPSEDSAPRPRARRKPQVASQEPKTK